MSSHQPLVLEGLDLSPAIDYVLSRQDASTTLVVCCSRASFIQSLQAASVSSRSEQDESQDTLPPKWSSPTLRLLASSRTIRLAFCPTLPHLRAFIATYALQDAKSAVSVGASSSTSSVARSLVVLNLVQLHRTTSAFSAQGLNRTFSQAVEASTFADRQLLFIECPMSETESGSPERHIEEDVQVEHASEAANLWDDEVSILNVTTKSFGVVDRGWVGRTVTVRQVAARWCVFKRL